MLGIDREVAGVARPPSAERVRSRKRVLPCATIKSILKQTGQGRRCPRRPNGFMVWFVVGMGPCATDGYRRVSRWLRSARTKARTPSRSGVREARLRLGPPPGTRLLHAVVRLRATPATPGVFYRGRRLRAPDGFVLDLPDTPANARVFGRPRGGRAPGAFPRARARPPLRGRHARDLESPGQAAAPGRDRIGPGAAALLGPRRGTAAF